MNTPLRLAGFGVLLAVVFAVSFGVGNAVGPIGDSDPEPEHHGTTTEVVDQPPTVSSTPTSDHGDHR